VFVVSALSCSAADVPDTVSDSSAIVDSLPDALEDSSVVSSVASGSVTEVAAFADLTVVIFVGGVHGLLCEKIFSIFLLDLDFLHYIEGLVND
jgi:hypothetical protein